MKAELIERLASKLGAANAAALLAEITAAGFALVPRNPTDAELQDCWNRQYDEDDYSPAARTQARHNWDSVIATAERKD